MDFCPEIEEGKHINLPTLHGWNSQHTFQAPSWRMTNMHELITPTQQGRILARLQPYKLCKSHISPTKSNTWNILKLIDIAWDMVSFSILTRCLDSLPSKSPMERMTSSPCHYSSTLYSFHQPTCGWPDWDDPDLPHALSQMWTPNAVTGLVSWDSRSKNWLEDQFVEWMHNTWFTNFTWFNSGEWVLFVDLFELSAVVGKKLEIPSRCLVKIDPLFVRFRYWINFRTSCAKVPCAPIFIITKVMTWFGNKETVGLFCSTREPHDFWYSVLAASWNSRHVVCSMIHSSVFQVCVGIDEGCQWFVRIYIQ